MVEGIVKSENSLISEINLEQSCLTGEGLYSLCYLSGLDLQILNLANNDLGNEACQHIRHIMPTIVELNLSNTKMGLRGCCDLVRGFEEEAPRLQILDLSRNSIESEGFAKLLQKLKHSKTITSLNVSENDFSLF